MHQTHFFYAIKLPDEVKVKMKRNIDLVKENLPFSRWVHHQDLLITLAFLGNAPLEQLAAAEN